ncbi:MAG: hypothetical protein ACOYEC_02250 [Christensenellales bacterium]|jgi:hypothetical protein|nr:hypothetical protein [Clostridiales bacterium]
MYYKLKIAAVVTFLIFTVVVVALLVTFTPVTITLNYGFTKVVHDFKFPQEDLSLDKPYTQDITVARFTAYVPPKGINWFLDEECTLPWVEGTRVKSNITLYACSY